MGEDKGEEWICGTKLTFFTQCLQKKKLTFFTQHLQKKNCDTIKSLCRLIDVFYFPGVLHNIVLISKEYR